MDSNQKRFIEDALDLLNELDEGLMQLEVNAQAKAPLEQVFRTMHTIKGGGNMFGFETIGKLAHHLENLFDMVRQGNMQVTDNLISLTLQSFDKVRDLLKEKDILAINEDVSILNYIEKAIEFQKVFEAELTGTTLEMTADTGQEKDELTTFLIQVKPTITITEDGNHPLVYIIQDMAEMGTSNIKIFKKQSAEIEQWEILLSTTVPQGELESYFIFVENECTVTYTKIAAGNLFDQPAVIEYLKMLVDQPIEVTQLTRIVSQNLTIVQEQHTLVEDTETRLKANTFNDTYIKVSKRKIDNLLNWISELIILKAQIANSAEQINSMGLTDATEQLDMITRQLRDTSLEIGLVPIETLVTKFKRLVRDLSKSLDKKVNFLSEGAETEIDKDVIEMMTEPMIHLIRNAIDHGVENPANRKLVEKTEHGTVKLKAYTAGAKINIIISDDGKGIDKDSLLNKAIEKGLISKETALTEDEILNLIFLPGLSTSSQVSDISGRGVGMDVVRQKIHELRGQISVKSIAGSGTSFHIRLPLSRSIIEGLLVKIGSSEYILPLTAVDKCYEIQAKRLTCDSCQKLILDGQPVPVFYLQKIFNEGESRPDIVQVIKMNYEEFPVAITVDKIIGDYQTVLKPLGDMYRNQEEFSGATILGNGKVALVLDTDQLIKQLAFNAKAMMA